MDTNMDTKRTYKAGGIWKALKILAAPPGLEPGSLA